IGPDPRNFNQRVSLGRNDLLIRTFPNAPIAHGKLILRVWSYQSCAKLSIVHSFDAPLHKTIAE
ncbi:hypothetical protein QDQ50_23015, partial [Enterobacter hormaechei]